MGARRARLDSVGATCEDRRRAAATRRRPADVVVVAPL